MALIIIDFFIWLAFKDNLLSYINKSNGSFGIIYVEKNYNIICRSFCTIGLY